jgi:hypothetical protein
MKGKKREPFAVRHGGRAPSRSSLASVASPGRPPRRCAGRQIVASLCHAVFKGQRCSPAGGRGAAFDSADEQQQLHGRGSLLMHTNELRSRQVQAFLTAYLVRMRAQGAEALAEQYWKQHGMVAVNIG